jgi:uncharacterized membrane protein YhaH (DUF805 family)
MGDVDINKLWQNFVDTLTNHYFDFNGRVGRAQFWSYVIVVVVLFIGVWVLSSLTTRLLLSLFSLALLLPNLGMGVRRLHDVGKPGIYVLLPVVPAVLAMLFLFLFLWPLALLCWLAVFAAAVLLIYWCAQPGMPGDNEYGSPPAS